MPGSFLVSTAVVSLAEIGDKTQLLSLLLAARFRKPAPIIVAIFLATLLNHGLAALLGEWVRGLLSPEAARWLLGLSLLAIAAWTLKPDKLDGAVPSATRLGVFAVTFVSFFFAEMGDKTQVATVVMAAEYRAFFAVVMGTTLGMMIANVPVVVLGGAMAHRIPLHIVRRVAAGMFAVLAVFILTGHGL
ncbi:MAG TPA: TMEM165/GDT1 family protein [Burkholderiales bacterium]